MRRERSKRRAVLPRRAAAWRQSAAHGRVNMRRKTIVRTVRRIHEAVHAELAEEHAAQACDIIVRTARRIIDSVAHA